MNKPIFSIIIPTYNRAWCIERSINSVLNQSNSKWELIIVDDGSTDNTQNIINKYKKYEQIRYFQFDTNRGVNFARNHGIAEANGKYIIFLDSDDELKSTTLETIDYEFNKIDNDRIGVLLFNTEDITGNIYGECPLKNRILITFKDYIKGDIISGEKFVVIKASVFKDSNFRFDELPGQMEGILWNRIAKSYDFLFVNKSLRIYHTEHNDRLTGSGQTIAKAKYQPRLYEKFLSEFEKDYIKYNPKKLAFFYFEKALNEIIAKKKKEGRKSIKRAISYNNKKILLGLLFYLASYLPTFLFGKLIVFGHKFKKIIK